MASVADTRPLVVHVVYRFDTGGLENGIVNLINQMPTNAYRHAIVALTEVTDFRYRILREDVAFYELKKPPGHGFWLYPKLYSLFRRLRPAIVHSRNLAALEAVVPAWVAGTRIRVHGEHGRDVGDLDGNNPKYQRIRRLYRPFVSRYIALSNDLADYLTRKVGVDQTQVTQIYNGVNVTKFQVNRGCAPVPVDWPFHEADQWVVGTVGRMQTVKDQLTLAQAFARALEMSPALTSRLRLVMVGEGPLRADCQSLLAGAGLENLTWLPGERTDVAEIMQSLNCFVLPSLAEGISNTILEAMACGLPVIATRVGGNADLVVHGQTGEIVPPADVECMAQSIVRLASSPDLAGKMGAAGRARAEQKFSLQAMVARYQGLYDELVGRSTIGHQSTSAAG